MHLVGLLTHGTNSHDQYVCMLYLSYYFSSIAKMIRLQTNNRTVSAAPHKEGSYKAKLRSPKAVIDYNDNKYTGVRNRVSTNKPSKSKVRSHKKKSGTAAAAAALKKVAIPRPTYVVDTSPFAHGARLQHVFAEVNKIWPLELEEYKEGMEHAAAIADKYYRSVTAHLSKGQRMNLIVLSESHSRTKLDILDRQILPEHQDLVTKEYHKGHVNLVHCLTYGEPWLAGITSEQDGSIARGTPTFWRILSVLSGEQQHMTEDDDEYDDAFAHVVKKQADKTERVKAKIAVLDRMKKNGIGFLDISPIHIFLAAGVKVATNKTTGTKYNTPSKVLPASVKNAIINLCWDHYMAPLLEIARPKHFVVLGKSLTQAIGVEVLKDFAEKTDAMYHGTLQHPSARDTQGRAYLPHLLQLRDLVATCIPQSVSDNSSGPQTLPQTESAPEGSPKKRKRH